MDLLTSWQLALVDSWAQVWTSFLSFLPTILGAIIVFGIGLLLAFWAKKLVIRALEMAQVESLAKQAGIDDFFARADFKFNLTTLLGTIVEWLIILVFFLAVVDILELSVVSEVLAQVVGYIPNVVAAALIFAAGYIVAGIAEGLVRGALTSVDHQVAKPLGRAARAVIILVATFAAIDQLQIARGLINTFFQGLTYTVVLAVGLSVGLGAKDLVARILNEWYDRISK